MISRIDPILLIEGLRLAGVLFAAALVVLTYSIAKYVMPSGVAKFAAAFAALTPLFVFNGLSSPSVIVGVFLVYAAVFSLILFTSTNRTWFWYLASSMIGISVATSFSWFLLVPYFLVLFRRPFPIKHKVAGFLGLLAFSSVSWAFLPAPLGEVGIGAWTNLPMAFVFLVVGVGIPFCLLVAKPLMTKSARMTGFELPLLLAALGIVFLPTMDSSRVLVFVPYLALLAGYGAYEFWNWSGRGKALVAGVVLYQVIGIAAVEWKVFKDPRTVAQKWIESNSSNGEKFIVVTERNGRGLATDATYRLRVTLPNVEILPEFFLYQKAFGSYFPEVGSVQILERVPR